MDFSSTNRLIKKQEFDFVFANPVKLSRKYLIVLYRSNQKPLARLGIIISKQVLKRAVDRNLTRRIVRESFRQNKEAIKGLDIIVLLRSKWTSPATSAGQALSKKVLRDDLDSIWPKLSKSVC